MVIALDATSTSGTGDTFANSKSVPAPAGAAAGKVVVITVEHWTSGSEPTVTNWAALGFTEVAAAHATMVTTSSPGNQSIRKAWKRLTAADTSWNLSFSATCWNMAHAELWSGALASGDPSDGAATATGSTGYPSTTFTPTTAAGLSNSAATLQAVSTTPPTNFTERQDHPVLHTNTRVLAAAGSVTTSGGTVSGNGEVVVSTLALKPDTGGGNSQTITPAAETDSAQTPAAARSQAVTPAAETDQAVTPARARSTPVAAASESDTALTPGHAKTITPAGETDTAVTPTRPGGTLVTPASETDTAVTPGRARSTSISPAAESDTGVPPARSRTTPTTPAAETDAALTPARARAQTVTPAAELDEALTPGNPNELLRDLDLTMTIEPGRLVVLVEAARLHTEVEPARFRTEIET